MIRRWRRRADAIAKKNGFASLAEFDDVSASILAVMSGIDPQTRKFTEPPEQIKKEIAALKANKSIPEGDKEDDLAQLEAELKNTKPVQFKENIAKYFDNLAPLMQEQNLNLRPSATAATACSPISVTRESAKQASLRLSPRLWKIEIEKGPVCGVGSSIPSLILQTLPAHLPSAQSA